MPANDCLHAISLARILPCQYCTALPVCIIMYYVCMCPRVMKSSACVQHMSKACKPHPPTDVLRCFQLHNTAPFQSVAPTAALSRPAASIIIINYLKLCGIRCVFLCKRDHLSLYSYIIHILTDKASVLALIKASGVSN